jgi:hypothetical protein
MKVQIGLNTDFSLGRSSTHSHRNHWDSWRTWHETIQGFTIDYISYLFTFISHSCYTRKLRSVRLVNKNLYFFDINYKYKLIKFIEIFSTSKNSLYFKPGGVDCRDRSRSRLKISRLLRCPFETVKYFLTVQISFWNCQVFLDCRDVLVETVKIKTLDRDKSRPPGLICLLIWTVLSYFNF